MHPALDAAYEPAEPGRLIRRARFLPGLATTADQIERFAHHWRRLGTEALSCDRPVVVALGDSLAQGIGATEPDSGYVGGIRNELSVAGHRPPVLNLSRSGARIRDVIETQLPALTAAGVTCRLVVCTVGSNDLVRSTRLVRTRRDMTELLDLLPAGAVVATVPSLRSLAAKSLNRHLETECARLSIPVADVNARLRTWRGNQAGDRFHPNDAGHRKWVEAFRPHLGSAAGLD